MNLESLVLRYQREFERIRVGTGQRVARAWDQTGGLTEDHANEFAPLAASIVGAGQAQQALVTAGYFQAFDAEVTHDGRQVDLDPELFVGLRGVDPGQVYRRPIIQARNAIAQGHDFDTAMEQGRARAIGLSETDISHTQSVAALASIAFLPKIVGYVRVLSGSSCPLCAGADGHFGRYEAMPIHAHCDCTSAPIYADVNPGAAVNESLNRTDGITPSVREHGELGPVLVDPDDDFTEVDDI